MNFFKLLVFLMIFTTSCKSQSKLKDEATFIEVSNIEIGKIHLIHPEIVIFSKATGIKEKFLSSSIYYDGGKKALVINDKKFNYEYFDKYDSLKATKLYLKKYYNKNKEFIVVIKAE